MPEEKVERDFHNFHLINFSEINGRELFEGFILTTHLPYFYDIIPILWQMYTFKSPDLGGDGITVAT